MNRLYYICRWSSLHGWRDMYDESGKYWWVYETHFITKYPTAEAAIEALIRLRIVQEKPAMMAQLKQHVVFEI